MSPKEKLSEEGLCSALFDTADGTGICEAFGPHVRHGGVLTVGVFRCHRCRNVLATEDSPNPFIGRACRCSGSVPREETQP